MEPEPQRSEGSRRGRPRRLDVETKRAVLLEAAVVAFADQGRAATKLEDVAARAEMSKAAVYELFTSKDQLYAAAAEAEATRFADHLVAALADSLDAPFGERTRRRLRVLFGYADERPAGFRFLLRVRTDQPADVGARVSATRHTAAATLADTIRADFGALGYPTGAAPDVVAALVGGMTESALLLAADRPDLDRDALIELLVTFTVAGLVGTDRTLLDAVDAVHRTADPTPAPSPEA